MDMLVRNNGIKGKCINRFVYYKHFAFHKLLTDGLELTLLRCIHQHSDGTHLLQNIQCTKIFSHYGYLFSKYLLSSNKVLLFS